MGAELDFIFESTDMAIIDDIVEDTEDAIDDLIDGASDMDIEDSMIPNSLVDSECDGTDYEKYLNDGEE